MSGKANSLAQEIDFIYTRSGANRWSFIEQLLQIIDRENILVLNRYRKKHGDPPILPEITRYKEVNQVGHLTWLIDVPKEWTSIPGKHPEFDSRGEL